MSGVSMPMFGRATSAPNQSDWGDVDNFDVEMLAEYLLEDGVPGMTFDFNAAVGGGLVSPENSEDGVLPTLADLKTTPGLPDSYASVSRGIPLAPAPMAQSTTFPTLPAQVPNMAAPGVHMAFHNHAAAQAPKRRRTDDVMGAPMVATAATSGGQSFLKGQQLAAAAAQALSQGRGRKKSQAQIDRRRERNRILARRTRLRKKFFFESLQKEVMDLQKQNLLLKEIVRTEINEDDSKKILAECDAAEKLPPSVLEAMDEGTEVASEDFNLVTSIQRSQHAFVITDPSLQDNPIVFASEDFLKMTGYTREQVLGRNCRFLQGTETSPEKVKEIQQALSSGDDVGVTLMNFKADGTAFWNKLFIAALRDARNNIVNYIGVLVKVASPAPGDPEHNKPLPKAPGSADPEDDYEDEDDDDA